MSSGPVKVPLSKLVDCIPKNTTQDCPLACAHMHTLEKGETENHQLIYKSQHRRIPSTHSSTTHKARKAWSNVVSQALEVTANQKYYIQQSELVKLMRKRTVSPKVTYGLNANSIKIPITFRGVRGTQGDTYEYNLRIYTYIICIIRYI